MRGKIISCLILSLVIASSVFVFGATEESFLTKLFLGFVAIIIAIQVLPALTLFGAMIKGALKPAPKKTENQIEETKP